LAKIAVALEQALERRATNGTAGLPAARIIAEGDGWVVEDVVCTAGPDDRVYEEQHSHVPFSTAPTVSAVRRAR
jgi:hypothetical protein